MGVGIDDGDLQAVWAELTEVVLARLRGQDSCELDPRPAPSEVREYVAGPDLAVPTDPRQALAWVVEGLRRYQVHVDDPAYMGRFNPAPSEMGVVADALVAAFNPQLAAWIYSPFAIEVEQRVIRELGGRLGLPVEWVGGTFTSGGAEANHTAVLMALTAGVPGFPGAGLAGRGTRPVVYVSAEGHHSVAKAARMSGLGDEGIRRIDVASDYRMDLDALASTVARDRVAGLLPVMVVGTAGTTGSGAVDPLPDLAALARREGLWFHVDAAWGGPLALVPSRRDVVRGLELADSLTLDAHKWLSVPMGAGMFLTRRPELMRRAFAHDTGYMPTSAEGVVEPYAETMQWSRRFIGLKLFLTLLVAGWEGYAETIDHQMRMLERLVAALPEHGWRMVNDPAAGVACFVDASGRIAADRLSAVADRVVAGKRAWITSARLAQGTSVLRVCITNRRTGPGHVDALMAELERARDEEAAAGPG